MSDSQRTDTALRDNGKHGLAALLRTAQDLERQNAELLAALKRIAAYPMTRVSEITASGLRDIAREAIRRAEG